MGGLNLILRYSGDLLLWVGWAGEAAAGTVEKNLGEVRNYSGYWCVSFGPLSDEECFDGTCCSSRSFQHVTQRRLLGSGDI